MNLLSILLFISASCGLNFGLGIDENPLQQKIHKLQLADETFGDALGRLNQSIDTSISIEGVLPDQGTIANPKLSADFEDLTVSEIFDKLCQLDGRYTWTRDGTNVNFFPRVMANSAEYLFNRRLVELNLKSVRSVGEAVVAIDRQSGDPGGGVIYLGIGQSLNFSQPWTESFHNITVREALNRVARQLGPTYGWQIGGTTNARLIIFHYKLEAEAAHIAGHVGGGELQSGECDQLLHEPEGDPLFLWRNGPERKSNLPGLRSRSIPGLPGCFC